MFLEDWEPAVRRREELFEEELAELLHKFPHHRFHRKHDSNKILFLFTFSNIQILSPMNISKKIGAFTGQLVFKDAEGDILDFSKGINLSLVADNAAVGNVALTLDANGNPTAAFTGNGIAAGVLTLTASVTNDTGAVITGTSTITFAADTTITEVDVNVN